MENNNHKKAEKLVLSWLCPQTGRKIPAGVAFFNESQGDFRLKIDAFPEDKIVYLKPTDIRDGAMYFRVETAVKRAGQVTHRAQIGTAYSKSGTGLPVFMDIGPYSKTLMLEDEKSE